MRVVIAEDNVLLSAGLELILSTRDIEVAEVVTENAVHKHIGNIFSKLSLPTTAPGHRRVLAVLAHLDANA